ADFGGADVGDDGEGRVVEGVAVLVELAVGLVEGLVLVLALVFPGEVAAFPDVNEAVLALGAFGGGGGDLDGFFEGVVGAGGVGGGGGGLVEQAAEVDEVFVGGGALGEVGVPPFFYELLGGHVEWGV